jgi:hypothetical protein
MASHKKRRIDEIHGEAEPTPKNIYSRNIMLRSIAYNTLRSAASSTPGAVRAGTNSSRVPAMLVVALFSSRYNNNNNNNAITHADHRRFMSGELLYAVDAPNGDHDLQDIVRGFVLFPEHTVAFFCLSKFIWMCPNTPITPYLFYSKGGIHRLGETCRCRRLGYRRRCGYQRIA